MEPKTITVSGLNVNATHVAAFKNADAFAESNTVKQWAAHEQFKTRNAEQKKEFCAEIYKLSCQATGKVVSK